MWNPNSDNNKAEDVSLGETTNDQNKSLGSQQQQPGNITAAAAGNGKTPTTTIQQQQHKKNLEGESSSSTYGGGGGSGGIDCTASSISCSGEVDSGFLSGPQLVEDYDDLDVGGGGRSGVGTRAAIPSVQLNIVHKQQQFTEDYQDSGCIDEDLIEEEENHHQKQNQRPSITTTAATPQTQQRELLVDNDDEDDDEDQMILDSGVDAGVTEWFCKLSLKDPSQQVNNLGAASQRTTSGNDNDTSGVDTPSWENYYQQNNEGDT